MVSRDSIDRMVDEADDLFEVWQDPSEQATEPAPTSAHGAVGEIALEVDFRATLYGFELGERTLTRYRSTYLIPEGVLLTTLVEAWAYKTPIGNVELYEQTLMVGLRFSVPRFLKNLLFYLGLAPG